MNSKRKNLCLANVGKKQKTNAICIRQENKKMKYYDGFTSIWQVADMATDFVMMWASISRSKGFLRLRHYNNWLNLIAALLLVQPLSVLDFTRHPSCGQFNSNRFHLQTEVSQAHHGERQGSQWSCLHSCVWTHIFPDFFCYRCCCQHFDSFRYVKLEHNHSLCNQHLNPF